MSKYEEDRLRDLLRSVTAALNKRGKEYDESQRALYEARESEKTALATADGLRWLISDLEAENAKLRDELDQWHRLTAGIKLPEYPITEFKPKDLERENAELRELVQWLIYCTDESELGVEVDA